MLKARTTKGARGTHVRYGKHGAEVDIIPVRPSQGGRGDVLLGNCHLRRLADSCMSDMSLTPSYVLCFAWFQELGWLDPLGMLGTSAGELLMRFTDTGMIGRPDLGNVSVEGI